MGLEFESGQRFEQTLLLSSVDPVELAREIEHVALKVMATEGLSASFYVRGSGINLSRQLQHRTGF